MKFLRRLFRRARFENTPRARRLNEVRHLDENSAKRRRAVEENRSEVHSILGVGRG